MLYLCELHLNPNLRPDGGYFRIVAFSLIEALQSHPAGARKFFDLRG